MNRRLEEEMLQTAFGEASPEETAELERRVMQDPEAAKALKTYQFIKDGLKDLGDVPEHQLSTDRLRHAILEQGLKPKRESVSYGWLALPSLAAAAVFGFVLLQKMNSSAPTGVGPMVAINTPELQPKPLSNLGPIEITRNDKPEPAATVAAQQPEESGSGFVRNETRGLAFNSLSRKKKQPYRVTQGAMVNMPPAPTNAEPTFEDAVAGLSRDEKRALREAEKAAKNEIVVIQPERDASTGASKATEVGSASNVAIGG